MTKTNYLLCSGEACRLRYTCWRYHWWQNSTDDEAPEMDPDYQEGECTFYEQREYYGG